MSSPIQADEDEVEEVEFVSVSHVYTLSVSKVSRFKGYCLSVDID